MSAELYFIGASETVSTGDKVVHGAVGEVMGPATVEGYVGKALKMKFAGNKGNVDCYLDTLSASAPSVSA